MGWKSGFKKAENCSKNNDFTKIKNDVPGCDFEVVWMVKARMSFWELKLPPKSTILLKVVLKINNTF